MQSHYTYNNAKFMASKRPENTAILGPLFSGKEKDPETGYHYFGARYYNSDLSLWLSVDPMSDKYPNLSPYNYCAWNPMKLADPDGMEINPIYDLSGNFLGTDDRGIQGDPIIMERSKFHQNMSHAEAVKSEASFSEMLKFCNSEGFSKFLDHSGSLSSRPDWDGIVTRDEGVSWAKSHVGALQNPTADNTLYINAALLDFGNINTNDFINGVGASSPIQTLTAGNIYKGLTKGPIQNTVYALGRVDISLLNASGDVKIVNNDATNYDWNKGGGCVRDGLIRIERAIRKLNDNHGFRAIYYGTGKVRTSK